MPISRDGLVLELLGELNGSNILDTSDQAAHASMIGDVAVEQGGHPLGDAFVFDGSGAASLPFGALVAGAAPRTVAFWFRRETNLSGSYETLYNAGTRLTARWFDITLGPGTLEFLNYGYGEENDSVPFDYAGAWHFVCFQYDGSAKRAWIDSEKVLDKSIILDTGSGFHELAQREGGYRFRGRIARLRIWNRALSGAEVAEAYNEDDSFQMILRQANTLGPDRAAAAMATGLGDGRSGVASLVSLGLESSQRIAGGLGLAGSSDALLGLGLAGAPAPALLAMGAQRLLAEPARLGRACRHALAVDLADMGRRAIIRHAAPLTGTGRAFRTRQLHALVRSGALPARSALDLADPPTRRRSHTVRAFLGGDEITAAVIELDLRMALDATHDVVSLVLGRGKPTVDAIIAAHRPFDSAETPRLAIHVDGAERLFLLEERDQRAQTTRLGGRSVSALAESPYAESVAVEGGALASEAAAQVAGACGLAFSWETHDWRLPADWIGSGPPAEILRRLAEAVGPFLRWDGEDKRLRVMEAHGGSLKQSTIPDCTADPLLDVSDGAEHGTGCNAVTVLGHAVDIRLPRLEVESPPEYLSGHLRGAPATVLAHWPAGRSAASWAWASHGEVSPLGEFTLWRRRALIPFVMGRARLDESPISLDRVQWIGASAGPVRLSPGSAELLCDPGRSGVALVDYAVRVQRFLLSGHDVPALVFLVAASAPDRAGVRVVHGRDATREEDMTIEEPLLTDRAGAVARGRSHLAWNSRPRRAWTVTLPYRPGIAPGGAIALDHGDSGVAGPCLVRAARLEARGPKLIHHLELVQWTD